LNMMNKVTHNYGIDIIILTIIIKIIFYPLTVKSSKSMKKMQQYSQRSLNSKKSTRMIRQN